MTVDELLERARSRLERFEPIQANAAMRDGHALLIDIRSETQRARDGLVPGALFVPRNALEWRCDPASPHRDARIDGLAHTLIVMCAEGYSVEPRRGHPPGDRICSSATDMTSAGSRPGGTPACPSSLVDEILDGLPGPSRHRTAGRLADCRLALSR